MPIELKDADAWQKWQHSTANSKANAAIMRFAESWAESMEAALAQGLKLKDVAGQLAASPSEREGLSAAMEDYGAVILVRCWKYGEDLRQWHNEVNGAPHLNQRPNAMANAGIARLIPRS